MSLASVADVEALLRRSLTAQETVYVTRLLGMADASIEAELPGVAFTGEVTGEVATFRLVVADAEIWLPWRPVNQVTEVLVDGDVLDAQRYVASRWGPLRLSCGAWPSGRDIQVTWDYGFASPPGDIVTLAADLVYRAVNDPGNKRQRTIGQYSETNAVAGEPALALTGDHLRRLRRYRTKRTSIPIESANPWWDLPLGARGGGPWAPW